MGYRHLLALCLPTLTACAGVGGASTAPWGQLNDIRIERADSKASEGLKLNFHAEYKLDNPLDRKLSIPTHRAWLEATPTNASGEVSGPAVRIAVIEVPPQTVAAASQLKVPYDFLLDLGSEVLAPLLGTDAKYAFRAEADVDLPGELFASLKDSVAAALPANLQAAGEDAAVAALVAQASKAAMNQVIDRLPAAFRDGKMKLAHEGSIRLPKFPIIDFGGSEPALELIGPKQTVDLGATLGDVQKTTGEFVSIMDTALETKLEIVPSLTLGGILEGKLGVPTQLTDVLLKVANVGRGVSSGSMGFAERTAMSTLLNAAGVRVPSSSNQQALTRATNIGIQALSLLEVLGKFNPEAAGAYRKTKDVLQALATNEQLKGKIFVPTAAPEGIVVRLPFILRNGNQFPISLPTLTAKILGGIGSFANVSALPVTPIAANADGEAPEIPPAGEVPMRFEAEIRWSQLGDSLVALASTPDLKTESMSIEGTLGVDVGYGLMEVPIPLK